MVIPSGQQTIGGPAGEQQAAIGTSLCRNSSSSACTACVRGWLIAHSTQSASLHVEHAIVMGARWRMQPAGKERRNESEFQVTCPVSPCLNASVAHRRRLSHVVQVHVAAQGVRPARAQSSQLALVGEPGSNRPDSMPRRALMASAYAAIAGRGATTPCVGSRQSGHTPPTPQRAHMTWLQGRATGAAWASIRGCLSCDWQHSHTGSTVSGARGEGEGAAMADGHAIVRARPEFTQPLLCSTRRGHTHRNRHHAPRVRLLIKPEQ